MSIQPWYCCLSLTVVGVGEIVHGFMLRGLGQRDSAKRVCFGDERIYMLPVKCFEVLRGDDAGAFTIYAVRICHLWEGLELGKCDFC